MMKSINIGRNNTWELAEARKAVWLTKSVFIDRRTWRFGTQLICIVLCDIESQRARNFKHRYCSGDRRNQNSKWSNLKRKICAEVCLCFDRFRRRKLSSLWVPAKKGSQINASINLNNLEWRNRNLHNLYTLAGRSSNKQKQQQQWQHPRSDQEHKVEFGEQIRKRNTVKFQRQ